MKRNGCRSGLEGLTNCHPFVTKPNLHIHQRAHGMSSLGTSDAGGKGKEMHTFGASSLPPLTIPSDPSSHVRWQALSLTTAHGRQKLGGLPGASSGSRRLCGPQTAVSDTAASSLLSPQLDLPPMKNQKSRKPVGRDRISHYR